MRCFRITPNSDPAGAFDGVGASMYPGRWNERNRRAVYVTTRMPLGILEAVVQDSVSDRRAYGTYPIEIPDDVVLERIDRTTLSNTWRSALAGRIECRALAESWFVRKSSLGLIVPSAVIPEADDFGDFNIVLDPTHADFARIQIDPRIPLAIDNRLIEFSRR